MSRFIAILALLLILIYLIMAIKKKLNKKLKFGFLFIFVFLIVFAVFWEYKVLLKANKSESLLLAFNQNKTLVCNDLNVSKAKFNYEFGTSSFISKTKSEFLIIPITKCELLRAENE